VKTNSCSAGVISPNGRKTEFPGSGQPTLLRDIDQPGRFVSFGAWQDLEQIEMFRHHPELGRHVARIRELLDNFTPMTFEAVIEPQDGVPVGQS